MSVRDCSSDNHSRRHFLTVSAALVAAGTAALRSSGTSAAQQVVAPNVARVAITLDLEMSRNFPTWEQTHWDYQKGNLDNATKAYTVEAARRVKSAGGRIHGFVVGQTLEQEDVGWLESLIQEGHLLGNHTYDHVNVLASQPGEVQFRFQRAPWLMGGKPPGEVIAENIKLAEQAMWHRLKIKPAGFRTPGGFTMGLKDRQDLQKLLLSQGYPWCSSLYPPHPAGRANEVPDEQFLTAIVAAQTAAQPFVYPTGLVEIPMSPISDIGAFRTGRWPVDSFVEATRRSLNWCIEHRAVFDFLCHPSCLVAMDPEFRTIQMICDVTNAAGAIAKLTDLNEIAAAVPSPQNAQPPK